MWISLKYLIDIKVMERMQDTLAAILKRLIIAAECIQNQGNRVWYELKPVVFASNCDWWWKMDPLKQPLT